MLTKASLSLETLAMVLEQSSDCVKLLSLDGRLLWMNPNGVRSNEFDDFGNIEGQSWCTLWPETARNQIEESYTTAAGGVTSSFEAFCPTAKGADRWWDVRVTQVKGVDGLPAGFLAISRDITDAYMTRRALDLALREMHHRLGNTYAIAGGLLGMFARGTPDREIFARDMQKRLQALHVAQSMFLHDDAPRKASELISALVAPFAGQTEALTLGELTDSVVDREQADAISLVLGELTVNSVKHGALSANGRITLQAITTDDHLQIIWAENLPYKIQKRSRPGGQGLALMAQIVKARSGNLSLEWSEFGLRVSINFPLARDYIAQSCPSKTDTINLRYSATPSQHLEIKSREE